MTSPLFLTHPFQPLRTILKKLEYKFNRDNLSIVRMLVPPLDFIVIRDAEMMQELYMDPVINRSKDIGAMPRLVWLMPRGGVANKGTPDVLVRKKRVQKAVKPVALSHYINCLPPIFTEYATRWGQATAPVEINHEVAKLVTQFTFQMFFSKMLQGVELEEISEKVEYINKHFMSRVPEWIPSTQQRRYKRYGKEVRALFRAFLREDCPEGSPPNLLTYVRGLADDQGNPYPEEDIIDEICSVYFGGGALVALFEWALYWISSNPEAQEKLYQEALSLPELSPERILELPYGGMVVKEILRLTPTFWCVLRETPHALTCKGYSIPANTKLMFSMYHTHRNPAYWERPHDFYPEHFLPENEQKRPLYSYFPFGKGARICLGQHLAPMCLQIFLTYLTRQVAMTHESAHPSHPIPLMGFENHPSHVRLNFNPRLTKI